MNFMKIRLTLLAKRGLMHMQNRLLRRVRKSD